MQLIKLIKLKKKNNIDYNFLKKRIKEMGISKFEGKLKTKLF